VRCEKEAAVNVSRLIWGIVCLAVAGLLAVLNLTLPPDKIMFDFAGENVPWLPPAILGILGVVLVATAWTSRARTTREAEEPPAQGEVVDQTLRDEKIAQNKRLESIGWGLFLVMLGGSILIPDEVAPNGWFTIGVGLIMLGLNVSRYFYGIRMSGFTTVLGVLAIASGIAELLGFDALGGGLLLIILGAYLLLKPTFDKRQLFGKVEG
jgi:putative Mn2+ efflux pump MntP